MVLRFEERPVQTRVKHQIQTQYQMAWGGIITNGLRRRATQAATTGRDFQARFLYFDGFCYKGRYLRDLGSSNQFEAGSPIIGIQCLDRIVETAIQRRGVPAEGIAILVERDPYNFACMVDSLKLYGYEQRIRQNVDLQKLGAGEIAIYNRDASTVACDVVQLTRQADTFSFALLDPYGPTGIPYDFVRNFVSAPRTDVMLYWPWYDLEKKAGMVSKSSLSDAERGLLQNYNAMYRDSTWQYLVEQAEPDEDLEAILVGKYEEDLGAMDHQLFVKLIGLENQDADRTLYYLFLTTRNPDGAFRMNQVLNEARVSQRVLKAYRRADRESQRRQTAPLFDLAPLESTPEAPGASSGPVDLDGLADDIYEAWHGQSPSLVDIKRSLANTDVYVTHVLSALRRLRRDGLADWEGTNPGNQTVVQFGEKTS